MDRFQIVEADGSHRDFQRLQPDECGRDLRRRREGARIYVTGVDDAKGAELMYFEIPMGK